MELHGFCAKNYTKVVTGFHRAPDNFLKQGVSDASLEAKGVFLQNAEAFSLPSFTQVRFYKLQILSQVKGKMLSIIAKSVT